MNERRSELDANIGQQLALKAMSEPWTRPAPIRKKTPALLQFSRSPVIQALRSLRGLR